VIDDVEHSAQIAFGDRQLFHGCLPLQFSLDPISHGAIRRTSYGLPGPVAATVDEGGIAPPVLGKERP